MKEKRKCRVREAVSGMLGWVARHSFNFHKFEDLLLYIIFCISIHKCTFYDFISCFMILLS
jgi:hypothetical protein